MRKYRFVGNGTYGGRSRPAAVPYIGDLFRGDEVFHDEEAKLLRFVRPNMPPVEATDQALSVLRGGDFNAEVSCEHRFASGEGCAKRPAEGSKFCVFHAKLQKKKPVEPPLPPDLVSIPGEMMLESMPVPQWSESVEKKDGIG